ncbi:MAG: VacJ family lipoprotein [Desulfovibrio sp.]|nr:VacJ family lipoprotein [Desulfovibrio sp.]
MRPDKLLVFLLLIVCLFGCTKRNTVEFVAEKQIVSESSSTEGVAEDLDDYEKSDDLMAIADPLEKWNRFWFAFNDKFFIYVAKPLYRGWEAITPHQLRTGLKNFLHNALFPVRFVNNLLQGRLKAAGVEFSRFMMDTMVSAGFARPSLHKKTIVPVDDLGEDFGQTLGVWGMGHGAYIVWPILGPSSLRESLGMLGDMFAKPFYYVDPWWVATAVNVGLNFNNLDTIIEPYESVKGSAIDPYISMRDAYIRFRNTHVSQ